MAGTIDGQNVRMTKVIHGGIGGTGTDGIPLGRIDMSAGIAIVVIHM